MTQLPDEVVTELGLLPDIYLDPSDYTDFRVVTRGQAFAWLDDTSVAELTYHSQNLVLFGSASSNSDRITMIFGMFDDLARANLALAYLEMLR